jgi:hypothetical protein
MNKLPIELLEVIISHLSTTDEQRHTNPIQPHDQQRTSNQQRASNASLANIFNIRLAGRALVATASQSIIKIRGLNPFSNQPLKVQECSEASDQHHADIFNIRLKNRPLAAAASRPFIEHIKNHAWTLDARSLSQLFNLLLDGHIAQRTTCLHLNVYQFSFLNRTPRWYSEKAHQKDIQMRRAYLQKGLTGQLIHVFRQAKNLKQLTTTPELFNYRGPHDTPMMCNEQCARGVYSLELKIFLDICELPNPLQNLQAALHTSLAKERLTSFTVVTHKECNLLDDTPMHHYTTSLTCANVTHLTIDPAYLMDPTFQLHCPHLRVLEIIHLERLCGYRPKILHERHVTAIETQRMSDMFESLRDVVLTGTHTSFCTSELYSLIAYIARFTRSLNSLTIRRTEVLEEKGSISYRVPVDGAGKRLDDFKDVLDFRIGLLRLEELEFRKDARNLGRLEEMFETGGGVNFLSLLMECADEVVVC